MSGFNKIARMYFAWLDGQHFSVNTIQTYRYTITKFLQYLEAFEVYELNALKMDLLRRFAYFRREGRVYAPKTTKLRLAALNLFLAWCYDQHYVRENLVIQKRRQEMLPNQALQKTDKNAQDIAILFPAEQQRLLDYFSASNVRDIRNRCIIALVLASGIHCQQLVRLKSDALDLVAGYLYLDNNNNRITIDLETCQSSCQKWLEKRQELFPDGLRGYLFANKKGEPLTERSIRKIVAQSLEATNITKPISGTDLLRQSAICNMFRKGKDIYEVRDITGIKTLAALEKYRLYVAENLV